MAFLALILPVVFGALEGASAAQLIGTAILSGLAFLLLRPHQQRPVFKGQSSAWGMPFDVVYNSGRIAGKVIQASQVTKHSGKKKGKKSPATYTQTFAVAFAEGQRTVLRIWADNQVIYDPRPITKPPQWQPNHEYASGDIVIAIGSNGFQGGRQFVATTDGESGSTQPTWNTSPGDTTRDNQVVWQTQKIPKQRKVGKQFNFILRVYNGDEEQLPDSALEEIVGTGNQSGYRGLVYCVFEQFNISKFGNRIPNLEAEIVQLSVPISFYTNVGSADDNLAFHTMTAAPDATRAYTFVNYLDTPITHNPISSCLAEVSLESANVLRISAPIAASDTGFEYTPEHFAAIAWNDPTKFWYSNGPGGGPTAFDIVNMGNTPLFAWSWPGQFQIPAINNPLEPSAISPDGATMVGVSWSSTDSVLQAVNLTSGSSTIAGAIGSSTPRLYAGVFDDSGHFWAISRDAHLHRYTVSQSGSGAPSISGATSFNLNPYGSFSFYGTVSFNPNTHYLTCWMFDNAAGFIRAIDFDTIGLTVVDTHLADDGSGWFNNPDQLGWSNKQFLAAVGGYGRRSIQNAVGLYDRNAGSFFLYEWNATWNVADPTGGFNPPSPQVWAAIANYTGTNIVSTKEGTQDYLAGDTFWFFPLVPGGLTLGEIVADVSNRIGLAGFYDYSGLDSVVPRGVVLQDRMKARQFLESMQPAYFFDLTDIGDQVIGTLRAVSTLLETIPETDLAASDSSGTIVDKITTERGMDLEIPRDLAMQYFDYQHDYQQSATPEIRDPITNFSSGRNSLTVPCVMTPGEASNAAKRALFMTWVERNTDKFSLPLDYINLTPADIVEPVRSSYGHVVRITRATLNPKLTIDVEAVSEDTGVYELIQAPPLGDQITGSFTPGQVNPIVSPILAVMDTAVLNQAQTQEPGVYATAAPSEFGGGFQGAIIQDSPDNSNFTQQAIVQTPATMGNVVSGPPLADWPRYTVFDRTNTLTMQLTAGQLASASEQSLIDNFTNAMWMANGEIIQFATATLLDADSNTWEVSDLLRGRLGTEQFTSTHGASETVVFLDPTTVKDIAYDPATLDQTLYWQAMNDSADDNQGLSQTETLVMTTRRLMPWAPTFIKGTRDGPLNLTITGLRRVRYRGTPLWHPPETDSPIKTEVDIMSGLSVVRTITTTASGGGSVVSDPSAFSVLYTAADQTADFGSPQASVSVKIYQLNAVRGRGYPGAATI